MKNIHVIPTEKPSRVIIYSTLLNEFRLLDEPSEDWKHKRNIYITSDEEIKEGDWFYLYDADIIAKYVNAKPVKEGKKIILTTDQALIADGVQAIDDEFLNWFVKNPKCEEVVVDESPLLNTSLTYLGVGKYKIIIPKFESCRCGNSFLDDDRLDFKDYFEQYYTDTYNP